MNFGYRAGQQVLRSISFSATPGSVTVIVGPSGAGKTTLFNLLTRLWDPEEGSVRIGGIDLRSLNPSSLGELVSKVDQHPALCSGSVYENLPLAKKAGHIGVKVFVDDALLENRVATAYRCDSEGGGVDKMLEDRPGASGHLPGGRRRPLAGQNGSPHAVHPLRRRRLGERLGSLQPLRALMEHATGAWPASSQPEVSGGNPFTQPSTGCRSHSQACGARAFSTR